MVVCPDCFRVEAAVKFPHCFYCQKTSPAGQSHHHCLKKFKGAIDQILAFYRYQTVLAQLLKQFKYQGSTVIQGFIGDLIAWGLEKYKPVFKRNILILPIPLHPKKLRQRGFCQTDILAKLLQQHLNLWVEKSNLQIYLDTQLLRRLIYTKPQALYRSKEKRLSNVKGVFALEESQKQRYQSVDLNRFQFVLVDDVISSGATIEEAAKVVRKSWPKARVTAMAVARG